ncbi:MAG: TlpA family protein disulfide reductase [Acidobacteria bacterium]|nr:TlpA family protein disulfide reductase [Acidobacteriota bacterium]MBI3664572.1 TlpA family protein disulfide reductase [Acidobacteriota bacterium]
MDGSLKRKLLSGLALAAAAALLLLVASPYSRQGEGSIVGSKAGDFSFEFAGKPARLSALRGKVVVLNFWATWCPPCVEEMPALSRLHQQIVSSGGMVLGISVDDDTAKYEKFLQDHQISFPNYRDPTKTISASYGTFMFPETYVIDKQGKVARKVIGPQVWDSPEMVAYLKRLAAQ